MRASIKKGIVWFCLTFFSFGLISEHVHFIKSYTDSLPEHYFVQLPSISPKKSDLTLVYNDFYQGNLIKQIIGVEGDYVWYDQEQRLWVNEQCVGSCRLHTDSGKKLTAISSQVIPKGYVFLYAPHSESFDSRYQEVGLVPVTQLQGKLIALW